MQLAALQPVCGDRIWTEKKSGMSQSGRTELAAMIAEAKRLSSTGEKVTICVYSLSRLGRRVVETGALIEDLQKSGIGFKSCSESIDTTTAMGRCFLNILLALAQSEAELLSERTKAGLQAKKDAGIKLGRKTGDYSAALEEAKALIASGTSIREAAKQSGLSNTTLLRLLNAA
jgi:DNA invertase Pin-like site-specific DNA recombinase